MRLAFRASDRQDVEDLLALPVQLDAGQRVMLGSVARLELARGPRAIERDDRRTSIGLRAVLETGATLPVVRERIEERLSGYRLPPGYEWRFGRGAQTQDEAAAMMQINLLLAIAMIFLVMAALFESTLLPLCVLASIVPALTGAVWTLFATGTPLTFMALIGMQILIGVVVNIGIVLVAQIEALRNAGLARKAAILQAARERLRPILMTTLTTVLGLLPLAVGDSQLAIGIGGPSYAPMAIAIIGGLAFGAVASMLFVPVFYAWLEDASAAIRRWLRGEPRPSAPVSAAAP
jgi:HAE1 family hydrophobic/amphiphilic exporter-1